MTEFMHLCNREQFVLAEQYLSDILNGKIQVKPDIDSRGKIIKEGTEFWNFINSCSYVIHNAFTAFIISGRLSAIKFSVHMYNKYIKGKTQKRALIDFTRTNVRYRNSVLILPADVLLASHFNHLEMVDFLLENAEWGKESSTWLKTTFGDSKNIAINQWIDGVHPIQLRREAVENVEKFSQFVPQIDNMIQEYM